MTDFTSKIEDAIDSFDQLSFREKMMVLGLVTTFCFILIGALWYFTSEGLSAREERCENLRRAVTLLERHEGELREARMADARTDARISESVPMLQGHLDKIASDLDVDVKEYKNLKDRTLGREKNYLEKSMRLRIFGIKIELLAKFLDRIEGGQHLILVSALDIQTRVGQPEFLDVDMVVSTYKKGTDDSGKEKKSKEKNKKKQKEKSKGAARKKASGA